MGRRFHPLFVAFAGLALLRAILSIGLFVHARGAGFDAGALVFVSSLAVQVGFTLAVGGALAALTRATGSKVVAATSVSWLVACAVWSIADPVIFALAGDHLTPSLLAHFAGPRIFSSDYLWRPIAAHPALTGGALLLVLAVVSGSVALYRVAIRAPELKPKNERIALALSVATMLVGLGVDSSAQFPPEVVFAVDALDIGRAHVDADDIETLRSFVALPRGARWLDERYPLVHEPPRRMQTARPDIVLVSIESMRGADMRWTSGRADAIELPALEALAKESVVFPRFVSNGFPSTEGFSATSFSAWPHGRRRIVLDFKQTTFDTLATRLASLGYRTVRVEDDPDLDEEGFWVRRAFAESVTFRDRGLYASERSMVGAIEALIVAHDTRGRTEPLFIDWKTAHPHMPYDVPDDALGYDVDLGSPERNYPASLRYVDGALGQLVDFLKRRGRSRDTVIVVLGDHSNARTRERVTPLPSDEMVWTGALIAGPSALVGEPRTHREHASQVDIMPTLLAMIGDARPTASVGRDLLAEGGRPERALVVRPGGLRLDAAGASTLFDRRLLGAPYVERIFERERAAPVDGQRLSHVVDVWSRLVEADRVWNTSFLRENARN